MVIGQIIGVHIGAGYLVEGRFDTARAGAIMRCGYRGDYASVSDMFEMLRPRYGIDLDRPS